MWYFRFGKVSQPMYMLASSWPAWTVIREMVKSGLVQLTPPGF